MTAQVPVVFRPPSVRVERRRRHTLYFLEFARSQRTVGIDTEVDMTRVMAHRAAARADGDRYSIISYLLLAAGQGLARHPEANATTLAGWPSRWRAPRTARFQGVTAKIALDRLVDGERTVLSALLPGLERSGLTQIQDQLNLYRSPDMSEHPDFRGPRLLGRLPVLLGRPLFLAALRSPTRRQAVFGTVSVSSLGHRPVDGFYSTGGTAVTLCLGRVTDRPVVRDGAVVVAPVMRLSLTFDHRVIDGGTAADLLGEIKQELEAFDGKGGRTEGVVRGTGQDHRARRGLAADQH